MPRRRLAFCDYHRQRYAATVPLRREDYVIGEFTLGLWNKPGYLYPGGEFRIALYALGRPNPWRHDPRSVLLSPHVEVFTDGFGALREFVRIGGLLALERAKILSRDDLSRVLLDLGLRDDSDEPLPRKAAA